MPLNSTSVIKIVDLLCEGPIEAIENGQEGIFLDETPMRNGDFYNFGKQNVSAEFVNGGKTQSRLTQFEDGVSNIVSVNAEIGENYREDTNEFNEVVSRHYGQGRDVRTITDLEVKEFQLLFTVPRLFSTAMEGLSRGQIFDARIKIDVSVQSQGSAFNVVYNKTISGVALSDYQFITPRLQLSGTGPWNIRVRKYPDPADQSEASFEVKFDDFEKIPKNTPLANGRGNQIIWTSIVEHQPLRLNYRYSALVGMDISTVQFNSLPRRAYKIKGKQVFVPQNAVMRDDGSLDLQGSFNGQVKFEFSSCPVCCFRDMLVNPRYGAGDFIDEANVSWVDLYPLIQYANQLVTNPDGTQEPRFSCNVVIGGQASAFNVLQDLASVFRGMLYWQANTIQATADHGNLDGTDVAPVHLYSNSNVINGAFNYSGSSLKTRSTSIRVRYNDPDNFYKPNVVVVEDPDLISKYGYQVKEIVGFGVTSKYQAQRLGRWMMASEELDGEVISFSTGLQGAVVSPGQVFAVADEMRAGARLSGRVSSATTTAITTDQTITLSGSGLKLTCRCISVTDGGEGQYAITGVEFNDSIYNTADTGGDLIFRDITLFNDVPVVPANLQLTGREVRVNNNTVNRIIASWERGTNAATVSYEVRYRVSSGNFVTAQVNGTTYEIDNIPSGTELFFEIRAVSGIDSSKKSPYVSQSFFVPYEGVNAVGTGEDAVIIPPPPIDVTIQATGSDQVILRWDIPGTNQNTDEFIAVIRHAPQTDGTGEWANSTLLRRVKARTNYALLPLIEGEYLVKFENNQAQRSSIARSAVLDLPNPIPRLSIETRREDLDVPSFQGDKVDVFYNSEYDGLILDGDQRFDDVVDVDALSDFDFIGDLLSSGRYYFNNVLDLGGVFNVLFERNLSVRGLYPANAIDKRNELIDRWTDFDGALADDTTANVFFRTSDQATTDEELLLEDADFFLLEDGNKIQMESDIDFGPWIPMESGRYSGRQFQFKVELQSFHSDQTPLIEELGYVMQLESRTESSATIASGAAAKAVTFTNAFYQEPNVGITAFNLATGDYYEVTSTSRTGFTVTFYNSSNTAVDRNFQYQAVGYGTEQ
ncbi:MAG: host specificity protein J [Marivivens sp.]|nr:host specificity protein J [Marivivens sp.]